MSKRGRQLIFPRGTEDDREFERGMRAEDLFFKAARLINNDLLADFAKPEWLHFVERPSPRDDVDGIDGWVLTDAYDIPVQVKSSWFGVLQHIRRYPRFRGIHLVIPDGMDEHDVAYTLVEFLTEKSVTEAA